MSKNNRGYKGLKQCLTISSEFLSDSNNKYYTNKFLHDVYIDSIGCFKRNNPFIKNELFHTFLIDSNNHLLYVGNPNRNLKAENALMEILKSQQQQLISSH